MFVGETGIQRVVRRSAELMKAGADPRQSGGVDLPTVQKYLNLWFTLSLDLFGGEISSNAADYFAAGLKGRPKEEQFTDHVALNGFYPMDVPEGGRLVRQEVPLRNAMNEIARDGYVDDCQRAVDKWNKTIEEEGAAFRLALPSRRFHRKIGIYSTAPFDPEGRQMTGEEWQRRRDEFLPSAADFAFVRSLMQPVYQPGKIASWVAPPRTGINRLPLEFEYVRTGG